MRRLVQEAFSRSLEEMFLTAVPIVLLAGVLALFIKEVPLGTRQDAEGQEDGEGDPSSSRSATSSPEVPTGSVSGSSSAASSGSSPTSV